MADGQQHKQRPQTTRESEDIVGEEIEAGLLKGLQDR